MYYQNFLKMALIGLSIFTISCTSDGSTTMSPSQNGEADSSTDVENISSSSAANQNVSSCSNDDVCSSSSEQSSTSLETMLNSRTWMWSGNAGKATVTISEKEEAYWLAYGDADLGGETFFTWENSINWYGSDDKRAVKDLSSYCNSICGTANFVESGITDGSGNYYAGIGFKMNPTDITSWNGFTVIYSSDMDLTLGIEEIHRSKYEYDDYRAKLPKTAEPKMITLAWEDFAQSGVGASQPLEKILKQVNMIDFQYFTKNAAQSNFKIYAIGKKRITKSSAR